jgi:hypothetical protein
MNLIKRVEKKEEGFFLFPLGFDVFMGVIIINEA